MAILEIRRIKTKTSTNKWFEADVENIYIDKGKVKLNLNGGQIRSISEVIIVK